MFWGFTLSIKVASRKAQKPRSCGSSLGQVHTSCQSACPEFRTAKSPCIMCEPFSALGDVQQWCWPVSRSSCDHEIEVCDHFRQGNWELLWRRVQYIRGALSTLGDAMSTLGDIMSTSGAIMSISGFSI